MNRPAGVFKDTGNNNWAGLSGTTYQFAKADVTAPSVSTYNPAEDAAGVTIASRGIKDLGNNNFDNGTCDVINITY